MPTDSDSQPTIAIDTRLGSVRGIDRGDALAFFGIRYGQPPTGKRRFLAPQASGAWTGTYDATFFHNQAMQDVYPIFYNETQRDELGPLDEDCLFLNVWTPAADARRRPVLLWLHGGGYTGGSANEYNGYQLARQGDVVVVTINYRLGAIGFLDLSSLGSEYAGSANNGIRDMILALEWARDNIADYGGDPNCVTVFGESSGAEAILLLLGAPQAEGTFHRAILHSPNGGLADRSKSSLPALRAHLKLQEDATPDEVLEHLLGIDAKELLQVGRTGPRVDGTVVTRSAAEVYAEPSSAAVPLILGTNRDEGTLVSYGMGDPGPWDDDADRKGFELTITESFQRVVMEPAEAAGVWNGPIWMYRLELPTTFLEGRLGVTHAADIPLTFNYPAIDSKMHVFYVPSTPEVDALAHAWSSTCIHFARTGDPNGAGHFPNWPRYDAQQRGTMVLDSECRVTHGLVVDKELEGDSPIRTAFLKHKQAITTSSQKKGIIF